ncbi:hypothetical protein Sango_1052300 [Sesamum angolense]|uniref:Uncharacterized protein n=1 Tax=Sesamum angolense TaxID=2727404 RepID=A0AAE2BZ65_9LAMI|nr:hypothetical protein Sango_1052300 [Sesamum angolense]
MRDCPKRGKLNALVVEADDDEGGFSWINPLQLKLGLTLAQHSRRIKAVNSEAKPIQGVAYVELKVGAWTGKCNLMVVSLDDFDVILGMDFMLLAHAMDFVRSVEKKHNLMSAMQVKTGLRHGEQTYLATLIEMKLDAVQEVPGEVAELLQEFTDIFPPELPKKSPPTTSYRSCYITGAWGTAACTGPLLHGPCKVSRIKEAVGWAGGGRVDPAVQSAI